MQTYELVVTNRAIRGNSTDMTLVRTSVGIDQVHVLFDNEEWLGFPVTITFAQGDEVLSQTLAVSEIQGSDEWVAEATVTVPYEVIDMTGPIRVTLQGTDSNGRHIITAAGAPLSVEEAGDVVIGDVPHDAPTVDQWHKAYADAMESINTVQGIVSNLQSQLESIVTETEARFNAGVQTAIDTIVEANSHPATTSTLGTIMVGNGLSITDSGVLSSLVTDGITQTQASQIRNLARLASYCFDTEFDENGMLVEDAKVKLSALPITEMVDGDTITVDDGKICLSAPIADGVGY